MRLGYDASPIRLRPSGVGHYAASLLDALRENFPDNDYLVFSHLGGVPPPGYGLTQTQKHSFPVKEVWMQLWLPRLLERTRPDLCHFTNHIAPLRAVVPYVLTIHDLSLVDHPEWHPRTRRLWMRGLMRPSALAARGIICASEATRRAVLGWVPIEPSRVRVVPLAARPAFHRRCTDEEKASVRSRYRLNRPFVLYVGNIEPRKNLRLLLEAFRRLSAPEPDLVIAGRPAWLARDFLRESARGELAERVRLLGYVPEEELPALYQSALAFVYPSQMEGFGLPVLEAMACGIPVLTSRVEPLASLVGDAGGLADPADAQEWAAGLEEILQEPRKAQDLAARAKERASEFSWARTAQATMLCYKFR